MKNNVKGLSVGEKLLMLRQDRQLSRKEVANELGISEYSLKAYELNQRFPRHEVKHKLAKFYDQKIGALFFDE